MSQLIIILNILITKAIHYDRNFLKRQKVDIYYLGHLGDLLLEAKEFYTKKKPLMRSLKIPL